MIIKHWHEIRRINFQTKVMLNEDLQETDKLMRDKTSQCTIVYIKRSTSSSKVRE